MELQKFRSKMKHNTQEHLYWYFVQETPLGMNLLVVNSWGFAGCCKMLQFHVAAFCWSLRPFPKDTGGPRNALLNSLEDCPWLQHKPLQCSRDLSAEVKAPPLEHRRVWLGSSLTAQLLSPRGSIAADKAVWKSSFLHCAGCSINGTLQP